MKTSNYSPARQLTKRGFWASLLVGALMMGMSSMAQAAVLNDYPDIHVGFATVAYAAGTDTLTATGMGLTLDDDGIGAPDPIYSGMFNLSATVTDTGILTGGTLSVTGSVGSYTGSPLLTGNLTAINFDTTAPIGETLTFLFTATGGDLASLYSGLGGILLHQSGFGIEGWGADFESGFYSSYADIGTVVPVPAALWLFGSGLIGLLGFGRSTRNKQQHS